ncbi:hypothetical protein [Paenibacillus xylaniclasticus]|uniref:hypothetical protein n=1 Tax=Paenibacillus xylaniclasticus TaxID=588083 RepID=UPI000FD983A9|nr:MULTISPECIES: hypothetical protein [Paenibacillus]GFN32558.1 hypothetical protein PCURB6_28180 [Paenibacillus curdlanolyticus]
MKYDVERARRFYTGNIKIYSCRAFEVVPEKDLLIPLKRFDIILDRKENTYGAWTGDIIRDDDRIIRETIANLFNNEQLKLAI